jgi:hypothetical protein
MLKVLCSSAGFLHALQLLLMSLTQGAASSYSKCITFCCAHPQAPNRTATWSVEGARPSSCTLKGQGTYGARVALTSPQPLLLQAQRPLRLCATAAESCCHIQKGLKAFNVQCATLSQR